jgi:multidrug efflux pump subunit AcrA (membrane-fusion protein)
MLVLVLVSLVACEATGEAEPTPQAVEEFTPMVSVTGRVVPAQWATVGAQTSGMVEAVNVAVGDTVAAEDVLVRLDDADAQLALKQAQATLASAEAQVARLKVGPREEEVAVAEAQLEASRAQISQAAAQRDRLTSGALDAEIKAAEAQVASAEAERLVARQQHDQTMECHEITKPDGTKEEICPQLGTMEERARFALRAAEEALQAAHAQLTAAESGAEDQERAANASVWAAAAQRDVAQAQIDLLKAGVRAEEIAVAEAAVQEAQVAVEAAELRLERTEIRAPFAGTVGDVHARVGEFVAPGQPQVTLGDLETLRIETTDLDEIDVGQISVGQEATVTFDAFPDRTFVGTITRISPMAASDGGGVNYTVIIELEEWAPEIRWGMTAFVDIEVPISE